MALAVAERGTLSLDELAEMTDLRPGRAAAVGWLARQEAVAVGPAGDPVSASAAIDPERAAELAAAAVASRRRLDRSRVDRVRAYAETRACRRRLLLSYFGESRDEPCGACDNCEAGLPEPPADGSASAESRFTEGTRVRLRSLGEGTVMATEGDKLVVLFDDQGYTTLSIPLVQEGELLRPAERKRTGTRRTRRKANGHRPEDGRR